MVPKGYAGITLFPFVFIKYRLLKENAIFLNHEQIHLRQQMEFLVLPFFIWYGIEFLIRFMQFGNGTKAYRNISFEREAYAKESSLDYLHNRSFWAFLMYI